MDALNDVRFCRARNTTAGAITDVKISDPLDLTTQMLEYSGVRK